MFIQRSTRLGAKRQVSLMATFHLAIHFGSSKTQIIEIE